MVPARAARLALSAVAALPLLGCEERRRSAPLTDQTVEITVVTAGDGGTATNAVMIGETAAFPLPSGDSPAPDRRPEMRAPGVYMVALRDGTSRPVYLGEHSLFFGPRLAAADAARPITFVTGARQAWDDPALRNAVIQVTRERERGELPEVLAAVATRVDPIWRSALASASPVERAKLAELLEPTLHEPAGDASTLLAATLAVDLAPLSDAIAARLAGASTATDRLAAAILLRALSAQRPSEASALACHLLTENRRLLHGDPLLGAALLASRTTHDPSCLGVIRGIAVRDACAADALCTAEGAAPELGTSHGDEPLCSHEQALAARDAELSVPKERVAERAPTTLWALATLYEHAPLPTPLLTAHARRRYAIDTASLPRCDSVDLAGEPCSLPEVELRLAACRAANTKGRLGEAKFSIDDATKKLRDVRRAAVSTR